MKLKNKMFVSLATNSDNGYKEYNSYQKLVQTETLMKNL